MTGARAARRLEGLRVRLRRPRQRRHRAALVPGGAADDPGHQHRRWAGRRPRRPTSRPAPTGPQLPASPSTATTPPGGPATGRTRSGSRSTSARCTSFNRVLLAWEDGVRPVVPDPDLQRRRELDARSTRPPPATAGSTTWRSPASARYVRMNGTGAGHRRSATRCGSSASTADVHAGAPCSRQRGARCPYQHEALSPPAAGRALSIHAINAAMSTREPPPPRGCRRSRTSRRWRGSRGPRSPGSSTTPATSTRPCTRSCGERSPRPATCPTGPPARWSPAAPAPIALVVSDSETHDDDPFLSRFFADPYFGRVVGGMMSVLRPRGLQLGAAARRHPGGPGHASSATCARARPTARSCSPCTRTTRCPGLLVEAGVAAVLIGRPARPDPDQLRRPRQRRRRRAGRRAPRRPRLPAHRDDHRPGRRAGQPGPHRRLPPGHGPPRGRLRPVRGGQLHPRQRRGGDAASCSPSTPTSTASSRPTTSWPRAR